MFAKKISKMCSK